LNFTKNLIEILYFNAILAVEKTMHHFKKSKIEYPEDILLALKQKESDFLNNLKMFVAMKYYELRKLSLGKAAELAGIEKKDFIRLLSQNKITIFMLSKEELIRDLENA
jgi:predicted HTH domain antitoxin